MLYTPQRRHAVSSLISCTQVFNLVQHFYSPNLLIFGARILAIVQINAAGFIHPERSLLMLSLASTALNVTAVMLHLLEYAGGSLGGKGVILDFVGQSRPASILRILSLDLLIYALQMTALTISYVNNRGNPTPVPEFPYEDPLLPGREMAEEVESDLEAGLRRRRKGADYDLDPLDEESWLDQQEAELDSGAADEDDTLLPVRRRRYREPPLILSMSLPHMLHIIRRLPAHPTSIVDASTPGTPGTPTPQSPRSAQSPQSPRSPQRETTDDAEVVFEAPDMSGSASDQPTSSEAGPESGVRGARGDLGRIPGNYWVGDRDA